MTTDRDAAWVAATTLGIAAAPLGLEHGAFERIIVAPMDDPRMHGELGSWFHRMCGSAVVR